jgi:hypothetical protein
LRDNLKVMWTEMKGTEDILGPGRARTIDTAGTAIVAPEQAVGHEGPPSPARLVLRTPGGRGHHPRLRLAEPALALADRRLERTLCRLAAHDDAVQRAMADLGSAIAEAFNPPGGGS